MKSITPLKTGSYKIIFFSNNLFKNSFAMIFERFAPEEGKEVFYLFFFIHQKEFLLLLNVNFSIKRSLAKNRSVRLK